MNSIKKLADIQCLINETYSDKEPLTDEQKASKKVFNEYCEDIRKYLAKLNDIEEELGVDLITLFKALKQRHVYSIRAKRDEAGDFIEPVQMEVYKVDGIKLGYSKGYDKDKYGIMFYNEYYTAMIDTEDYGRRWTLTKEELE